MWNVEEHTALFLHISRFQDLLMEHGEGTYERTILTSFTAPQPYLWSPQLFFKTTEFSSTEN